MKNENADAISSVDEYYPSLDGQATGISQVSDNASLSGVRYFTTGGIEVANPDSFRGVLIRKATLSNGKSVASKVVKH